MNATPVSKEEVRAVVMELGYNQAGEKLGIKPGTLRQWAKRFSWNQVRTHAQETVTTVTKPVDVLASELATHENTTRLRLAKYASNAAAAIHKSVHPTRYTRQAKDIAGVMATVHRQDEQKSGAQFSLNVLNLSMFGDDNTPELDA